MKPYYEEDGITIYCADCRDVLPHLPKVDLVLTDPPYGMAWDGKVTRGKSDTRKKRKTEKFGNTIQGDKTPPDLSILTAFDNVIIFGANHYPDQLTKGTFLVWLKRYDGGFGSFLSDAEVAWMNKGHGVYCRRDMTLCGDSKNRHHPTEKPVGVMKWCLEFYPDAQTILDPFMGSGTTLVAAKQLGRKAIGIELEEKYCEIAVNRLRQGVLNLG